MTRGPGPRTGATGRSAAASPRAGSSAYRRASIACPCRRGRLAAQPAAGGDVELQRDEVEPGGALGDRVLDLQAGVHLEEVEPAVVVGEELDRARTDVADRRAAASAAANSCSRMPSTRSTSGEGASSIDLLVPALDGALAFADRPHRAVGVGEDLHLDVPAGGEVALAEHGAVTERGLRLGAGQLEFAARSSRSATTRMPRPPPPAEALTSTGRSASVTSSGSSSSSTGHAGRRHQLLGLDLLPIASMASGGGPIQVSPASATARAKAAFSERKP